MRLFLSSDNFGKYPDKLIGLAGSNKKVAYIGNARDYCDKKTRKAKVNEHRERFEALGFRFVEFDLRNYFTEKVPDSMLEGFGLVWCAGGNTFLLNAAFTKSGFRDILIKAVGGNKIAYGGSSAGSIIATPSLHGTEHGDDPSAAESAYDSEIVWEGMNFVQFYIAPHYKSGWFGEQAENMVKDFMKNKREYVALEDGQVIVVDGDQMQVLK